MSAYTGEARSTTIRVDTQVRDLLADRARTEGVSMNDLLREMLARDRRERAYAAHRAAVAAEALSPDPAYAEDLALWATTDRDGLDRA
jgi:hypothetical protein